MAVLQALRRTPGALVRNPVVFVPILVLMAFQLPQMILQGRNPLLSSLISLVMTLVYIVVMPFFQGGVISMADESLDGRTSLRTFIDDGKANYVSILVAYLLLLAVNFILGLIAVFVGFFGGAVFIGAGGLESANTLVIVGIAAVVGIIVLAYLLVLFFIQFYGQAIVIDDFGPIEGLKHSVTVVRNHLVSTFGYSVLCGIIGGVFGAAFGVASLFLSPQTAAMLSLPTPSLPIIVVVGLLVLLGGTIFGGFFGVFSVSFYRAITD